MRPNAAIATFGKLTELESKMAHGIIRYCDHIKVIIDHEYAGMDSNELLPYVKKTIPIVSTLEEAMSFDLHEVVIGSSPPGGKLTERMIEFISSALTSGLWVVHGMHASISNIDRFKPYQQKILELRNADTFVDVAHGHSVNVERAVILIVGSDCACGKMTTALDLTNHLREKNIDACFIATGQTGMYIAGNGIPIDAIKSDFVAGAVEQEILLHKDRECLVIEGQGSLFHPAYSGVTLSLLHGASPNVLLFAHDLGRKNMAYYESSNIDVPSQIHVAEVMASIRRSAPIIAIVAMASGLQKDEAKRKANELTKKVNIPVFLASQEGAELADLVIRHCNEKNLF